MACLKGNLEFVKVLLKYGANLKVVDEDFNTPLHLASQYGRENIVKYLLENHKEKIDLKITNYAKQSVIEIT